MKKIHFLLFIIPLFMVSSGRVSKENNLNRYDFNKLIVNSSVICRHGDFRVSGFIFNNSHIVSTYHVFHEMGHDSILNITFFDRTNTKAKVVFIDEKDDLFVAILKEKVNWNTLQLEDLNGLSGSFNEGDHIYGIGSSINKGDFKLLIATYEKDTLFDGKRCNFVISNDKMSLGGACGSFMVNESLSSFALWRGSLVPMKVDKSIRSDKSIPWKDEMFRHKFLIPKNRIFNFLIKYKNARFE